MSFDLPVIKFGWDLVQTIFVACVAVYAWFNNNHKANKDKIVDLEEKHNKELDNLNDRLIKIETTMTHMPSSKQMERIHDRLDEVNKHIFEMQGMMKGITDNNDMLIKHFLSKGE